MEFRCNICGKEHLTGACTEGLSEVSETGENTPEIPRDILEDIKSEAFEGLLDWRNFVIRDIEFALRTCESKREDGGPNGQPAEYFFPEGKFAIYIWEDLLENIQRVLLFHEIVEIYLRVEHALPKNSAHNATLIYEEQFRKELLSEEEEALYQKLRSDYSF